MLQAWQQIPAQFALPIPAYLKPDPTQESTMHFDNLRPRSGPLPTDLLAISDKISDWRIEVVGHD